MHVIFKLCATFKHQPYYCKGLSNDTEGITCEEDIIRKYENNKEKETVKPEDYRFCKVIQKTAAITSTNYLVDISGM